MLKYILMVLLVSIGVLTKAQVKEFECSDDWLKKIEELSPAKPEAEPQKKRNILVFDLHTGYNHWVIPHTSQVIMILGKKSGAYETIISKDIYCFEMQNLMKYDAVVLNNTCSVGPRRNLLLDVLDKDEYLSDEQRKAKANELEANLIKYVENGGGLIVTHGAIVMQNNSMPFSEMIGGSFDYHPPQQKVTLELVDKDHPLVKAFEGKTFVHTDEPYLFNNAYEKKNFRPLLYMDTDKLTNKKKPIDEKVKYVAWIKKHGKGRVFYVSPSHNAQSFEDTRLLKFYLDGTQYAIGDLSCDDTPLQ